MELIEEIPVYFEDLDPFGTVFHGHYVALVNRALEAAMRRRGIVLIDTDGAVLVKEFAIVFEQPITGTVPVGVRIAVEHIGRTSARLAFTIESDGNRHATGHRIDINLDPATKRPSPWSPALRAALEAAVPNPIDAAR